MHYVRVTARVTAVFFFFFFFKKGFSNTGLSSQTVRQELFSCSAARALYEYVLLIGQKRGTGGRGCPAEHPWERSQVTEVRGQHLYVCTCARPHTPAYCSPEVGVGARV